MPERRPEARGLGSPGWIAGKEDARARSPCVILDISQCGAKLAVKEASTLPENLRLYFSPTAQTFRQCVVTWRKEDSVGVQFEKQRL